MTMLPQPPPDAPAPPPCEEAMRSHRWWRWIWVTGAISITILLLSILSAPVFFRRPHGRADQTEAVNNARQIGLAMLEFQAEYGKFPDGTTIAAVQAETGKIVPPGTKTSNDFFRQLFAANMAPSESMFYAKSNSTRKPDGLMGGIHLLEKGECGFTYFLGAVDTDNPKRPLAVSSMIPGTDRFDPEPFQGKAVILHMDNSVYSLNIDKAGHAILGGRNLMDPHHPIWDGHAPTIAWPDL
jgi:type II secretory pathway pseudopilin PulG